MKWTELLTRPPNTIAKANTRSSVLANPHNKKAARELAKALTNMICGYGIRSVSQPINICPTTPNELKSDRTIVAENGEEKVEVKATI